MNYSKALILILIISFFGCRNDYMITPGSNFENNIQLKKEVVALTEEDQALIESVDSLKITMIDHSFSNGLNVGDVIVSSGFESYPKGFLRRIVDKKEHNGNILLETEHAKMSDAFSNYNFGTKVGNGDTLTLRDDKLKLNLISQKITLADKVGVNEANRIKTGLLQLLDIEDLVRPSEVEFSLTASAYLESDYDVIVNTSSGYLDFNFRNTTTTYSLKPEVKIGGKLVSLTDKKFTFCDLAEQFGTATTADFCDNNTFTLFGVTVKPPITIPGTALTFSPFFRISLLLSASLQGSLGFELSHETTHPIADFNIRASSNGLNLTTSDVEGVVFKEDDIKIKITGDVKAEGKLGVGFECGLSFYDQEALNVNLGAEFYLAPKGVIKGSLTGKISEYLAQNATASGEFAISLDAKVDLVGKINSDISQQMGFDPSNWISARKSVYSKPLIAYYSNCGNYKDYSFRSVYSKSTWVTWNCDEIGLEFEVSGVAGTNRTYSIDVQMPDGSIEDYFDLPYNESHYMDFSGRLNEGDELSIGIYNVEDNCFIAQNIKYVVPSCDPEEWLHMKYSATGPTQIQIQRFNLDLGGNNGSCYDMDTDNCAYYGKLYSWDDLVYDGVERSRSYCPDDGVVPSLSNWKDLILRTLEVRGVVSRQNDFMKEIGPNLYAYNYNGANNLKEKGEWLNTSEGIVNSWLQILPSGEIVQGSNGGGSSSQGIGKYTGFWTSTSAGENAAYAVFFSSELQDGFVILPVTKETKLSCRCVK